MLTVLLRRSRTSMDIAYPAWLRRNPVRGHAIGRQYRLEATCPVDREALFPGSVG